ncbi:hypothetical protein [uncultured Zhongshania sp.]|uniref:hypothetical protein n=1 Tax=uncultured Zhongshania sp. TaxID=1642288 RepID=UPI0030DA86BA
MANIAHLDTPHVEHAVDSFKLMLPAGRLSGTPKGVYQTQHGGMLYHCLLGMTRRIRASASRPAELPKFASYKFVATAQPNLQSHTSF